MESVNVSPCLLREIEQTVPQPRKYPQGACGVYVNWAYLCVSCVTAAVWHS